MSIIQKINQIVCGPKQNKRQSSNTSTQKLNFCNLEPRQLLAGITLANGVVTLDGGNGNDVGRVTQVTPTSVRVSLTGFAAQTFDTSSISYVRFLGRNGNDVFVNGSNVSSRAYGQHGNDRLTGGTARDFFQGGTGDDTLVGRGSNDGLRGNGGDDIIRGGNGNDGVFGGTGNDQLFGESGYDRISGNSGRDTISGGTHGDRIWGGDGNDNISGDRGNDTIFGGNENDTINGGDGNDELNGGNGNDVINGGNGGDLIRGDAGNDTMQGNAGFDRFFGGAGTDSAAYLGNFADYTIVREGRDVVFTANDGGREVLSTVETLSFKDGDRSTANTTTNTTNNTNNGERESLRLLNQLRRSNGASNLSSANDLNAFAENWSREMSQTGFRHSTQAARDQLKTGGRTLTAENIAFVANNGQTQQQVAQQFHNLWSNSTVHFTNMVNTRYTEVGIGIILGADNVWYGTQVFTG